MTEGDICEEENNNLCGCFSCHYTRVSIYYFLQSGMDSISKENIDKENEFKNSLDVVAQPEEPDEKSKEFANKLGADAKNIVSTGNTIKALL